MQQSLKVVTGFTLVPVEERRNVTDTVASVKQSFKATAHRLLAWLRATAPLHSRVAGEAFTRLQVLACYAGVALLLIILGLAERIGGAL